MKKMFPEMLEVPNTRAIAGGIPYWFFAFFIFPALLSLATSTHRGQPYEVWFDIGYHLVNFIVVLFCFLPYLKDSFFMVQVHTKKVLTTTAVCAAVVTILKIVIGVLAVRSQNSTYFNAAFGSLITTETDLFYYSTALLAKQPLWGTLCLVFAVPFTTTCLLYASVFAPLCERRPWLAYLITTAMLLVKHMVMVFCLWTTEEELAIFLVTLPTHLVACWAYEQTDTVWTPILIHIISNGAMALLTMVTTGIL